MLLKKETEQQFLRPNHKASPPAGEKKSFAQRETQQKTKLYKERQGAEKSRKGGKFPSGKSLELSAWLRPTWLCSRV